MGTVPKNLTVRLHVGKVTLSCVIAGEGSRGNLSEHWEGLTGHHIAEHVSHFISRHDRFALR